MLADLEVEAFHKLGVDLTAPRAQYLLDGLDRAEHDAVAHAYEAPAAHGLDHLDFLPFVKATGEVFTSP
jgi:hypothetical protein